MIQMTIGKKLYELRKSKNWSQEYVADKIGVSRQAVSRWELDESMPDIENLSVLSSLFSVTIDELVNEKTVIIESQKAQDETYGRRERKKKKISQFICIITGVIIVGVLLTLSTIIPSRLKTEMVVHRDDIVLINPNGDINSIPEEDIVTSYIETKGLIPFLNT